MSWKLTSRVHELEAALTMLSYLENELRYTMAPVQVLLEHIAAYEELQCLPFLQECVMSLRRGAPFRQSWEQSIMQVKLALEDTDRTQLCTLGQVIGMADLESQLHSISNCRILLQNRLETARDNKAKLGKLYQTIGALGAAIVFIVLL